jgi:hypothetical protein
MIHDTTETAVRTLVSDVGELCIGCEGTYPIILRLEIEGGELLYGMNDEMDLQQLCDLLKRGLDGTP